MGQGGGLASFCHNVSVTSWVMSLTKYVLGPGAVIHSEQQSREDMSVGIVQPDLNGSAFLDYMTDD